MWDLNLGLSNSKDYCGGRNKFPTPPSPGCGVQGAVPTPVSTTQWVLLPPFLRFVVSCFKAGRAQAKGTGRFCGLAGTLSGRGRCKETELKDQLEHCIGALWGVLGTWAHRRQLSMASLASAPLPGPPSVSLCPAPPRSLGMGSGAGYFSCLGHNPLLEAGMWGEAHPS